MWGKTKARWEEIQGFASPGEYDRFVQYVEDQVASGLADELPAAPGYFGGVGSRWFRDRDSGEVWRLDAPDPPFRGAWRRAAPPPPASGA
jgi:hypothetical protein